MFYFNYKTQISKSGILTTTIYPQKISQNKKIFCLFLKYFKYFSCFQSLENRSLTGVFDTKYDFWGAKYDFWGAN